MLAQSLQAFPVLQDFRRVQLSHVLLNILRGDRAVCHRRTVEFQRSTGLVIRARVERRVAHCFENSGGGASAFRLEMKTGDGLHRREGRDYFLHGLKNFPSP